MKCHVKVVKLKIVQYESKGCTHLNCQNQFSKYLFVVFLLSPIISPVMKTKLTAHAMQSFFLAILPASLSGPDIESVCWQSQLDCCWQSTPQVSSVRSDAKSAYFSLVLKECRRKTTGFLILQ